MLTLGCLLVAGLLVRLLLRPGEPPILLMAVGFQWVQVAADVARADYLNRELTELAGLPEADLAVWLSLVGLVVLAAGMKLGRRIVSRRERRLNRAEASSLSVHRIFLLYLALLCGGWIGAGLARSLPRITQFFIAAAALKWMFLIILAYYVFSTGRNRGYLIAAVVLEIALGLTGYFAGFTTVFLVLLAAAFTIHWSSRRTRWVRAVTLGGILFGFSVLWMAVRLEYRPFLNQGTGLQIVSKVPVLDRYDKLLAIVSELSLRDLRSAADQMVDRVGYTKFFGRTITYVPASVPHEHGKLWGEAIAHVVQPRLFFPDKPVLGSDSERTIRYTGYSVAGEQFGTSVSLGYMAESYIDFGRWGMFVPVFILGVLWGTLFAFLVSWPRSTVFGFAAAITVLINAMQFEISNAKLIGGVLITFLVVFAFIGLALPWLRGWLERQVSSPKTSIQHSPSSSPVTGGR